MRSIGDFFKRIGGLQHSELGRRQAVHDAIYKVCSLDIPVECISIKNTTISIDISHMEKSVIKLHTQAILDIVRQHSQLSSTRSII